MIYLPRHIIFAVAALALSAPTAFADSNTKIKFQDRVNFKVGQAMIIHGRRGDCGQLPSKAELSKSQADINAKLTTGRIRFGKEGVRRSGSCNGWTPAYETIFVAETPGRETVKIHGDSVRITVR